MSLSRRALLAAATAAVPAVAGCVSGGSNVHYPSATGTDGTPRSVHTATPEEEQAGGEAAERSRPHRELARETHRVYREVRWFAVEYPETMRQYLREANNARLLVAGIAGRETFDLETLDNLGTLLKNVHDEVEELLSPHFRGVEEMRDEAEQRLSVARRFTPRGDLDRAREALRRLRDFYARRADEAFVQRWYPRHPIRNRLARFVRNRPRKPDEPYLLTEVRQGDTGFAAYVHATTGWHLLGDPVRPATRDRLSLFAPLHVDRDRVDTLTVVPRLIRDRGSTDAATDPTDGDDPVLSIQRYESAGAANAAVETMLAGEVSAEGRYPFPDTAPDDAAVDEWRQVYYPHPGDPDVAYAFLAQAGPYLLATGVSEVSWTERVEWAGPLKRTWVWDE